MQSRLHLNESESNVAVGLGDDLLIGGLGKDSLDGEAGNNTGLGGQGGAARGGNGLKNSGDSLTGIELIDEALATMFPWE